RALYANTAGKVVPTLMAPVIADRNDKRFGHRLVIATFTLAAKDKASKTVRIEIDLSTEQTPATDATKHAEAPLREQQLLPTRLVEQHFPPNVPQAQQQT